MVHEFTNFMIDLILVSIARQQTDRRMDGCNHFRISFFCRDFLFVGGRGGLVGEHILRITRID